MSTTELTATCDCCGADGRPLDSQDYCEVCAAKLRGWELGQRTQAIMALGDAVMAATMQDCTADANLGDMISLAVTLTPPILSRPAGLEHTTTTPSAARRRSAMARRSSSVVRR